MTNTLFEEKIKSSLEHSTQTIDAETAQRLKSIRNQSLNQPQKNTWLSSLTFTFWGPAIGLTFCSVIATILLLPQLKSPSVTPTADQTAMLELIENPEELEVISDPGFYLWLDELKAQDV